MSDDWSNKFFDGLKNRDDAQRPVERLVTRTNFFGFYPSDGPLSLAHWHFERKYWIAPYQRKKMAVSCIKKQRYV